MITRRLASDKVFLFLITLMSLGVVAGVIVYILKKSCPEFVKGKLC